MGSLEKRLEALVGRMQAVGFADVRGELPVIRVEGTWEGDRLEFSYVADGELAIDQFFRGAEQSVAKLLCKRDHKRQTWCSLGVGDPAHANDLAPCAEEGCSQGTGSPSPMVVSGVEIARIGKQGSRQWAVAPDQHPADSV